LRRVIRRELAHAHGHGFERETREQSSGDPLRERFDQPVVARARDLFDHAVDLAVVDGVPQAVGAPRGGERRLDLEVDRHGPAHAPLGVRDAERGGHLDAFEQDHVRSRRHRDESSAEC
jgi:hypothetical protein